MEILVFGGTSEGRELAEWLAERGVRVVACCATEYGGELVSGTDGIEVVVGPLSADEKARLVRGHDFAAIVDATHPYATHITESIAQLADDHGIERIRLLRDEDAIPSGAVCVDDAQAAARAAAGHPGNILLTTGSKDLQTFAREIGDFQERLYVRVLPVPDSIARTRKLGIPASHVVAMQGPFSEEMNVALMCDLNIRTLVTKASGTAGGFDEKARAAKRCGANLVVIGRPQGETGLAPEQVQARLQEMMPLAQDALSASDGAGAASQGPETPPASSAAAGESTESATPEPARQRQHFAPTVYLIGMGPGDTGMLTQEARDAIARSELLIGAKRLLEQLDGASCEKRALIRADDIVQALDASNAAVASVLFSGDVGFYSGATALAGKLDGFKVEAVPGISSLVYFCAKLLTPWQDAHLVSAHGRESDPVAEVASHAKTFFLTGGKTGVRDICELLCDAGLGGVDVAVGERLSYSDERITRGSAAELAKRDFDPLAVMLVENPAIEPTAPGALENVTKGYDPFVTFSRLVVAAPASGGGKTTFSCGLMQALVNRGLRVEACKCGPDYIDPMFHREVIGADSHNLDLFFMSPSQVRETVAAGAQGADIAVIEGVMGYYDGIATSADASAWDVARTLEAPTLLVVDGRGRARSIAAEVLGFTRLRKDSRVAGVVLNRVSAALYPRLKALIEEETGVKVYGHVPVLDDCSLESRHLGLVTASEVDDLREKLGRIADALEKSVDIDGILELARSAPPLDAHEGEAAVQQGAPLSHHPTIAVARDDAFCFYYDDTLRLLESLGAELAFFSPIADTRLPEHACGLYLGGGYPELHARELSENASMRASVKAAIEAGMPTIAECGGFLYLHDQLEDDCGTSWPLVGCVDARAFRTPKLGRFGYITMTAREDNLLVAQGGQLRAHEFHYWDSSAPGSAFHAVKPQSTRNWDCAIASASLYAGFPHLCLHAQPEAARRFVNACADWEGRS